jgi:hypothetical protein
MNTFIRCILFALAVTCAGAFDTLTGKFKKGETHGT